ncbi:MAG: hypothetical protein QNJ47_02345 [Nostocaceae cyanobacterium]|nr:hypothetical protein [Nostocaceae cyanobacterium]
MNTIQRKSVKLGRATNAHPTRKLGATNAHSTRKLGRASLPIPLEN